MCLNSLVKNWSSLQPLRQPPFPFKILTIQPPAWAKENWLKIVGNWCLRKNSLFISQFVFATCDKILKIVYCKLLLPILLAMANPHSKWDFMVYSRLIYNFMDWSILPNLQNQRISSTCLFLLLHICNFWFLPMAGQLSASDVEGSGSFCSSSSTCSGLSAIPPFTWNWGDQ